ncbi:MAG: ribbon-helix-helix protein, CopG family [Microlunatus sp.]
MVDLLIRNMDVEDVRSLDVLAAHMGISRGELLRRQARSLARRGAEPMTRADLDRSAAIFTDALDEGIMEKAWR